MNLSLQFWIRSFILCNCIFIIFNILILGVSTKSIKDLIEYSTVLNGSTPTIYTIAIILACIDAITAVVGILGFWKELKIITYVHIVALIIITIIELCIATVSAVTTDPFFGKVYNALNTTINGFHLKVDIPSEYDELQIKLQCCGLNSREDFDKRRLALPHSCQYLMTGFKRGCIEALTEWVQRYILTVIGLCFTVGIIQAIYLFIIVARIFLNKYGKRLSA
ncbi:25 kDa integral membrane protein isoform 2 [Schistosoma japonicum]|uniref:25 kDa integral membrane protein isoform 2 n=1 Tax=Schistosoma japonicum TaxID=6182 RepID=Q5DDB8_SCHJA|nr:SJCHGC02261 protein [Schistosoma japonicum]KAH8849303.1 25 kDa integral membrane protein [Schistosoma japonicum]TNN04812.1 25 kDa integral membrane protein isoform 2 [Schistosoma japonicum]